MRINSRVQYVGPDSSLEGKIGTVTHELPECRAVEVKWDGKSRLSVHSRRVLIKVNTTNPERRCSGGVNPKTLPLPIEKGDYVSFCGSGVDFGKRGVALSGSHGGVYDIDVKFDTEPFSRLVAVKDLTVVGTGVSTEKCGTQKNDSVKAPSHYMLFTDVESIEVIARSMTVAEFKGFCFGNVLKYRLRAGKKSELATMEQDLKKAAFYQELFDKHKEKCYGS